MVAVLGEQVVGCALEGVGGFFDYGVDFGGGGHGESVQDLALECSSWGYGAWWRVVDSGHASSVVASVCIFAVVDHDAGMEEGGAYCP